GTEQAGPHSVQRELQEVCDFRVTELFEFAEHNDFAVDRFQFLDGAANPQARLSCIGLRRVGNRVVVTQRGRAKSSFATMGAQDFESNGVEIGAEERSGFVTGGGAEQGEKRFLRKLFGVGRIRNAAAEKAVNRLLVTMEEFSESLRGSLRESKHEALVAR